MTNDGRSVLLMLSSTTRKLDFYDPTTGEHLGEITDLLPEPHEMAADRGRGLVYVTHTYRSGVYGDFTERSHEISVVDVATRTVVDVIDISPYQAPHDVEYNAARDRIYVGIEAEEGGPQGIVVVDPQTRTVVDHIATQAPNCHWLVSSPDGSRAYATHKEAPFMTIVDLENNSVLATVELPGGAEEINIAPDGSALFAATPMIDRSRTGQPFESKLVKLDPSDGSVLGEVILPADICGVWATSRGDVLVSQLSVPGAEDFLHGVLWVVDGKTMEIRGSVDTGRGVFTLRASDDGALGYVANAGDGTVSVVDMTTLAVVRVLDNSPSAQWGGTHGLAVC